MKVSKPTYGAVSVKSLATPADTAAFSSVQSRKRNNTKGELLCYQTQILFV